MRLFYATPPSGAAIAARVARRHLPAWLMVTLSAVCLGSIFAVRAAAQTPDQAPEEPNAPQLFGVHCASCHTGESRAPSLVHLSSMSARAILASLETGRMVLQAEPIDPAGRRALAELLSGHELEAADLPPEAFCADRGRVEGAVDWSGWGGAPSGTGYRSASAAGIDVSDVGRLELAWAFAFPGATQSRTTPALVGDHLIVASAFGDVAALRRDSGCVEWLFSADAAVRGAIVVVPREDGRPIAYLADFLTNVYALDVGEGDLIWKTRVGRHPQHSVSGSVAVHDGRVFVPLASMEVVTALDPAYACCTSSGGITALSAHDGTELWYHRVLGAVPEGGASPSGPSGAPIWSSPTIDTERGRLYFGTGQSYTRPTTGDSDAIRALDLATGQVTWTFQATEGDAYHLGCGPPARPSCPAPSGPDFDFGMAPMLVSRSDGRELLVAGQKSGVVYALDPDEGGALVWSTRVGRGGALGGVHWGMASDGRYAYAPVSDRYDGGLGGDAIVGPPRPGLHAIDLLTGDVAWSAPALERCAERENCFKAFSAAPTAIDDAVFQGGLDGWLRAYAAFDGQLLWEFDAVREFETVGGVLGRGGAMDGPGPVVGGGMLFVNAGYGTFGQMPGNVLLAFRLER